VVGSLTKTCVTAPTIRPSCKIGLPLTSVSSRGQKKIAENCEYIPKINKRGGFHMAQPESLS